MRVAFFGHRDTVLDKNKIILLKNMILEMISKNSNVKFYMGDYGKFDVLCYSILTELKVLKQSKKSQKQVSFNKKQERIAAKGSKHKNASQAHFLLNKVLSPNKAVIRQTAIFYFDFVL